MAYLIAGCNNLLLLQAAVPTAWKPGGRQTEQEAGSRFLRFPGGCYVEGVTLANAFYWKPSVGPIDQRPGHWNGMWQYWSTDGAQPASVKTLQQTCCSSQRLVGVESLHCSWLRCAWYRVADYCNVEV